MFSIYKEYAYITQIYYTDILIVGVLKNLYLHIDFEVGSKAEDG